MTERISGLGEWLTDVRGDRSQSAFAAEIGISRDKLANYEVGRSRPRRALIQRIAESEGKAMPVERQDGDETAWLVEHGPTHGPAYLRLCNGSWCWTLNPFLAFRCARREDAEALNVAHGAPHVGRVCEHSFDGAPP